MVISVGLSVAWTLMLQFSWTLCVQCPTLHDGSCASESTFGNQEENAFVQIMLRSHAWCYVTLCEAWTQTIASYVKDGKDEVPFWVACLSHRFPLLHISLQANKNLRLEILYKRKKERWDSLTTIFAADGHQPALPDDGCQRTKTHEHEAVPVQVWVFGGTPGETYRGSLPESSAGCRSKEVRHWRGHLGWWNVPNAKGLSEQPSVPALSFSFSLPLLVCPLYTDLKNRFLEQKVFGCYRTY